MTATVTRTSFPRQRDTRDGQGHYVAPVPSRHATPGTLSRYVPLVPPLTRSGALARSRSARKSGAPSLSGHFAGGLITVVSPTRTSPTFFVSSVGNG